MKTLELGCGVHPTPDAVHHDRIKHSPWVDIAHDLDVLPYPFQDGEYDTVIALDVMEHTHLEIDVWLNELWRIMAEGGTLILRLPAWDNPVSWRDPTHRKVFHEETFDYWDKSKQLHKDYGFFYFQEANKWWKILSVTRANGNDLGFVLQKVTK